MRKAWKSPRFERLISGSGSSSVRLLVSWRTSVVRCRVGVADEDGDLDWGSAPPHCSRRRGGSIQRRPGGYVLAVCRAISACGARLSSGHVRPNDPSSLIGMPVTAAETFDTGRCIGPKRYQQHRIALAGVLEGRDMEAGRKRRLRMDSSSRGCRRKPPTIRRIDPLQTAARRPPAMNSVQRARAMRRSRRPALASWTERAMARVACDDHKGAPSRPGGLRI